MQVSKDASYLYFQKCKGILGFSKGKESLLEMFDIDNDTNKKNSQYQ